VNKDDIFVIDDLIRYILNEDTNEIKLSFETTALKNYFFHTIKKYVPDAYIINCISSEKRIYKDLISAKKYDLVVFDNIKKSDINIENINMINSKKIFIY
jgi:hypothetical protein